MFGQPLFSDNQKFSLFSPSIFQNTVTSNQESAARRYQVGGLFSGEYKYIWRSLTNFQNIDTTPLMHVINQTQITQEEQTKIVYVTKNPDLDQQGHVKVPNSNYSNQQTPNYQIQMAANVSLSQAKSFVNSKSNGKDHCLTEIRLLEAGKSGNLDPQQAFETYRNQFKQSQDQTPLIFHPNPTGQGLLSQGSIFNNNTKGLFNLSSTSSGGLFGQTTTQGSIFGQTSSNGSSLFGQSTQQGDQLSSTPNYSGLFGVGGGLFLQSTSSMNQQRGLFGQSTNTGGLFGQPINQGVQFNQNPNSGGLFGQSTAQGGIFGQSPSSTSQGSSLFGQSTSKGGLFGQSTNTGGLFGQPINQGAQFNQNSNSGGLFGQSTVQGGIFSQSPSSTSINQGGLFGQNNNLGGLIGQSTAQGGLFSQSANSTSQGTTLFGQPSNVGSGGTLMGQPIIHQGGLFGGNNNQGSMFSQNPMIQRDQSSYRSSFDQQKSQQHNLVSSANSGGLFNNNTISGSQQGQSLASGGLFGSSFGKGDQPYQPTSQGGLFGQQKMEGAGLGQSNIQGGLFSQSNPQNVSSDQNTASQVGQFNQSSNQGGLFGQQKIQERGLFSQSNIQHNQQLSQGGEQLSNISFSSNSNQGIFSQFSNNSLNSSTYFVFGNNQIPSQTQGEERGTTLFGNQQNQPNQTGGFILNNTNNQNTNNGGGGLFNNKKS